MAGIHVLHSLPRTPFIPPSPSKSRSPDARAQLAEPKRQLFLSHPHTVSRPQRYFTILHPTITLPNLRIASLKLQLPLPLYFPFPFPKPNLPTLPFNPTHLPAPRPQHAHPAPLHRRRTPPHDPRQRTHPQSRPRHP